MIKLSYLENRRFDLKLLKLKKKIKNMKNLVSKYF